LQIDLRQQETDVVALPKSHDQSHLHPILDVQKSATKFHI